jgi:hypothetical protein
MEPTILTEDELGKVVSALLFASSVNVVFNKAEPSYFESLKNLALRLKEYKPDIQLQNTQFIKEDQYEDPWTHEIHEQFKNNIEVTTFENV